MILVFKIMGIALGIILLISIVTDFIIPRVKYRNKLKVVERETANKKDLDDYNNESIVVSDSDLQFIQINDKIFDKKFETKAVGYFGDALRRFVKNKSSLIAFIILLFIIFMAIVGPGMGGHDANTAREDFTYLPPKIPAISGMNFFSGKTEKKRISENLIISYEDNPTADPNRYYFKEFITDMSEPYTISTSTGEQLVVDFNYDMYALLAVPKPKVLTYDEYQQLTINKIVSEYFPTGVSAFEDHSGIVSIGNPQVKKIGTGTTQSRDWYLGNIELGSVFNLPINANNDAYNIFRQRNNNSPLYTEEFWQKSMVAKMSGVYIGVNGNWWIDNIDTNIVAIKYEVGTYQNNNREYYSINGNNTTVEKIGGNPIVYSRGGYFYILDSSARNGTRTTVETTYFDVLPKVGTNGNWWVGSMDTNIASTYEVGETPISIALATNFFSGNLLSNYEYYQLVNNPQESIFIGKDGNWVINLTQLSSSPNGDPRYTTFSSFVDVLKRAGINSVEELKYLFGTDSIGRDLWARVWTGTRTSLLIGLFVAVVTITVGILYGSIAGFYGGYVDLVMQRIIEILTGIPWIVIMTLVVLYLGANIVSLGLALVLTSWTGTATSVRTQFYRYKNREYVLAARTLGARDSRLIFKHILPNALGTIVTSSVLIIPSAIFSEASISYLGLGMSNGLSIGKLLSDGQGVGITSFPHMTIFPALIISILMICFNLFGNGLRDALNPSLRGVD